MQRFSPRNKGPELHIRFPSLGVLHQENEPPKTLGFGLTFRIARGLGEIEPSLLKCAHQITHALRSRAEAVI